MVSDAGMSLSRLSGTAGGLTCRLQSCVQALMIPRRRSRSQRERQSLPEPVQTSRYVFNLYVFTSFGLHGLPALNIPPLSPRASAPHRWPKIAGHAQPSTALSSRILQGRHVVCMYRPTAETGYGTGGWEILRNSGPMERLHHAWYLL